MALARELARQDRTTFRDLVIGRLSSNRLLPLTGSSHSAAMGATEMVRTVTVARRLSMALVPEASP